MNHFQFIRFVSFDLLFDFISVHPCASVVPKYFYGTRALTSAE